MTAIVEGQNKRTERHPAVLCAAWYNRLSFSASWALFFRFTCHLYTLQHSRKNYQHYNSLAVLAGNPGRSGIWASELTSCCLVQRQHSSSFRQMHDAVRQNASHGSHRCPITEPTLSQCLHGVEISRLDTESLPGTSGKMNVLNQLVNYLYH